MSYLYVYYFRFSHIQFNTHFTGEFRFVLWHLQSFYILYVYIHILHRRVREANNIRSTRKGNKRLEKKTPISEISSSNDSLTKMVAFSYWWKSGVYIYIVRYCFDFMWLWDFWLLFVVCRKVQTRTLYRIICIAKKNLRRTITVYKCSSLCNLMAK